MAYAQTNPLSLTEGRLLEGEKGLAYWCMPTFLHSLFLFLILFFFLHFVTFILSPSFLSFSVLTRVVLWWRWCCNSLIVVATVVMMILCTARALYILPAVTFFTILPFTTFVWIWVSFPTTYWFVSYLATTTYSLWLCHSPLPDKENCFICFFIVAFLSTTVWVFSLAIPHGMHLVFPIHHSLFWVVCHPNKTFPLKEFE